MDYHFIRIDISRMRYALNILNGIPWVERVNQFSGEYAELAIVQWYQFKYSFV